MKRSLRHALPVLGLAAAVPFAAQAQQPQQQAQAATCDIDQNKPGSLTTAVFSITRVQASTDTAAKHKALREAVRKLSDDASAAKSNPLGTAYTLAQDVQLANAATRGGVGLGGDASAPVDLLRLVDSTLTVVEQAKPGCAENVSQLRQFAWLNTMNAALAALNAQQIDSAAKLAERSTVVYKASALPYYVLSVAAQQKGDNAQAMTNWTRIVETTVSDTTQTGRELRSNAMFNLAATSSQGVDELTGEAQKTRARAAAQAMRTFLDAYPQHADAPRMQASYARMVTLSGDSAAVATVYADQLSNPTKYNDLALTQAGVIASQAGRHDDAAKLFASALEQNRFQRDALNNLAATYMQQKKFEPMLPLAQRLIAIDPANPDNYLFVAIAYQGLANATKVPAQKKAYTDSLIKWNRQSEAQTAKVTFSEFTRSDSRATLGVNVENLNKKAAAARPARPGAAATGAASAPRTYALTVEFLDKDGNVVDTQQASVGPVAPGETKQGRVESAKGGIVAFRYKVAS
jgi:tetratricopeptide (TPR) repeat protein